MRLRKVLSSRQIPVAMAVAAVPVWGAGDTEKRVAGHICAMAMTMAVRNESQAT
jgi:hypothetical protein